jgi:hypothetical protein
MALIVYTCERCDEPFADISYRVMSEDARGTLLNMIVCHDCYLEASQLGLDAEPLGTSQIVWH